MEDDEEPNEARAPRGERRKISSKVNHIPRAKVADEGRVITKGIENRLPRRGDNRTVNIDMNTVI